MDYRGMRPGCTTELPISNLAVGVVAVVISLFSFGGMAVAQSNGQAGFRATHFNPVPSQDVGILNLRRPDTLSQGDLSFGAFASYSDEPLKFRALNVEQPPGIYIKQEMVTEIGAAVGVLDFLQITAATPVASVQWGRLPKKEAGSFPYGDSRIGADVVVVDPSWANGFGASVSGVVYIPTGEVQEFTSDGGIRIAPQLSLGKQFSGGHEIVLNAGMKFGRPVEVPRFSYSDAALMNVGVGGVFQIPNTGLGIIGSVFGTGSLVGKTTGPNGQPNANTAKAMEALAGLRVDLPADLRIQAGGGMGLNNGLPAPDFRLFTSVHWSGLVSKKKPSRAEDEQKDQKGQKRAEAEQAEEQPSDDQEKTAAKEKPTDERDTQEKEKVATKEEPTDDQQKVATKEEPTDDQEKSTDPKKQKDQKDQKDQKADRDSDGDGIADASDGCAESAEDEDGFEDGDGCPDADNDGDAIADAEDNCPDDSESANDHEDEDGCPDEKPEPKVVEKKVAIDQTVQFEKGSAAVSSRYRSAIDAVANMLQQHEQITRVRIEGYTDTKGATRLNDRLSRKRAQSVKDQLVERGIDAERLEVIGNGEANPVASNDTQSGREKNRRVEFVITEIDGKAVEKGEAVIEKKVRPETNN